MLPTTDDVMKNLTERFEKMLLSMSNLAESPWMPPALGQYLYVLERRAVQVAMKLAARARVSAKAADGGNGVSSTSEPRHVVSSGGMNAVDYSLADFFFSESDDPMVAAPESIHRGIEEIIAEIDATPPDPAPSISITYWIVTGAPDEKTSWSPRLDALGSVLEGIASADGPTEFALLEKVDLRSRSGERASAETRHYWVDQRATSRAGGVLADLNLSGKGGAGKVRTRVNLEPGKTLVLGQSALPQAFIREPSESSLYFIVRAQVEPRNMG